MSGGGHRAAIHIVDEQRRRQQAHDPPACAGGQLRRCSRDFNSHNPLRCDPTTASEPEVQLSALLTADALPGLELGDGRLHDRLRNDVELASR